MFLARMVDLAHEEAQPFLLLFAFGNILHGADDTHGSPPMSGTLEMNKCCTSTQRTSASRR